MIENRKLANVSLRVPVWDGRLKLVRMGDAQKVDALKYGDWEGLGRFALTLCEQVGAFILTVGALTLRCAAWRDKNAMHYTIDLRGRCRFETRDACAVGARVCERLQTLLARRDLRLVREGESPLSF